MEGVVDHRVPWPGVYEEKDRVTVRRCHGGVPTPRVGVPGRGPHLTGKSGVQIRKGRRLEAPP